MVLMDDPGQLERLGIKPGQPATEAQIQRAVFQLLRANQVMCWPVPNNPAARRTVGFVEGVADVHALHNGEFFALELKSDKGRASLEQMEWTANANRAGGFSFISHGLDNAIACLKGWGLIR